MSDAYERAVAVMVVVVSASDDAHHAHTGEVIRLARLPQAGEFVSIKGDKARVAGVTLWAMDEESPVAATIELDFE